MATIVPSITEENLDAFNDRLAAILAIPTVQRVQVDFADGKFTPRKLVDPGDLDVMNPAYIWEAHVMSENPENYFFDLKLAGFNTVIFHFEAIQDKNSLQKLASDLRDLKLSPGLALKAETNPEEAFPYLHLFDQVTLLTVKAGYQGQPFIESGYQSLEKLRNHDKNVIIEVDGAVKMDNAKKLVQLGADYLVVGSGLFQPLSQDNEDGAAITPSENFEKFTMEVQNL